MNAGGAGAGRGMRPTGSADRCGGVRVCGMTKGFPLPDGGLLPILRGVDLVVEEGEAVAIMGASGSGKTTLLHILSGIESADAGVVELIGGRPGLVFQAHYLVPELDARENVALAARLAGVAKTAALSAADRLLREVGLTDRARHRPAELSGGEAARVALARSLASSPRVVLADEPTGSLDEENAKRVLDLLFAAVRAHRVTLVLVTHDADVAARADRTLKLEHGVLR